MGSTVVFTGNKHLGCEHISLYNNCMKIYVSHSREFDYVNELYAKIKESDINKHYQFIFPHENGKVINSKEEIKNCDLILAEVSFPSTGQGIELGWGDLQNIPIICICKENYKASGSLGFITTQLRFYSDLNDMIIKISELIAERR